MTPADVFVETNFLFCAFRMPSKRRRDALALMDRFEAGQVRLHVPYPCFQEARYLIARSLPANRCADLLDFHRHAVTAGTASWEAGQVEKFFEAATAEVNRTKAVYQREIAAFAQRLGDGIIHATREVFDLLEAMPADDDALKYNDKLILTMVLTRARELRQQARQNLIFMSLDKTDLQPTPQRPGLTRCYQEAGVLFVSGFELPESPASAPGDPNQAQP